METDYALIFGPSSKRDLTSTRSEVRHTSFLGIGYPFVHVVLLTITIIEFYAATEGNTSMVNPKNKQGAVGWIPPLVMRLYPLELIRLEDDNEVGLLYYLYTYPLAHGFP